MPTDTGTMRVLARPDVDLAALAPPDGNPDRLLGRPDCRIIKDQRKVTVGVVEGLAANPDGVVALYVKRYNVFSARVRWASLFLASPAVRAWRGAGTLVGAGFLPAPALAAIEFRHRGLLAKSFFVTARVEGAVPIDQYWWNLRRAPGGVRRAFVADLARLFAALHRAAISHGDLKDANVLVREAPDGRRSFYLLDLERVHRRRGLSTRRRVKNLVQVHRTLGRLASLRENLYFLRYYLEGGANGPAARRWWWRRVCRAARCKDLRHALRGRG
jgi:hypothetical protein